MVLTVAIFESSGGGGGSTTKALDGPFVVGVSGNGLNGPGGGSGGGGSGDSVIELLRVAIFEGGIVANSAVWKAGQPWVLPDGCSATAWQDGMQIGQPWPLPEPSAEPEQEQEPEQ